MWAGGIQDAAAQPNGLTYTRHGFGSNQQYPPHMSLSAWRGGWCGYLVWASWHNPFLRMLTQVFIPNGLSEKTAENMGMHRSSCMAAMLCTSSVCCHLSPDQLCIQDMTSSR